MINEIKQAALDAVQASNPMAVMFGTVTSTSPLAILVDQRFTLTQDFLVIAERVTRYERSLRHNHDYIDRDDGTSEETTDDALLDPLVIRHGLKKGDSVLLLRVQGGQSYVVLDKVVTP